MTSRNSNQEAGHCPQRPEAMRGKIGLVLGSGAARGFAHIGVIRALHEAGIEPAIICGSSIGALVGAAYSCGRLDPFEEWVRSLEWLDIVRVLDPTLAAGGFIEGESLMRALGDLLGEYRIEQLPRTYAAVATALRSGQEIWLKEGSLLDAVRASIALPGLFTPVRADGQWLTDGGLVNPVPVSLGRALGADYIIAVNLNGDIVGRHLSKYEAISEARKPDSNDLWGKFMVHLREGLGESSLGRLMSRRQAPSPGLFDVIASSINVMQDRITRSRLAGDPPDLLINPRLAHIGLLEFDRADEAIEEGQRAVRRLLPALLETLDHPHGV